MAVEWTEPRMVFEISLQAMTHQQHFEKMQVDSFVVKCKMSKLVTILFIKILPMYIIIPTKDLHA